MSWANRASATTGPSGVRVRAHAWTWLAVMLKMGASFKAGAGNGKGEGETCEEGADCVVVAAGRGCDGSAEDDVGTCVDEEVDTGADGFVVTVMHSLILVTVVDVSPDDRS